MLHFYKFSQKLILFLLIVSGLSISASAQKTNRVQPTWWFGQSGALNFNNYRGTTQMLNSNLSVPTAFHKGNSVRPYISLLTEYRPNKTVGGMLNIAWDNRGGEFNTVIAPCNCPADLSTGLSYLAIEPSLRLAPFSSAFYVFVGPTLGINLSKAFVYKQDKQVDVREDWSDIRKTVFSAQAGLGIDIPVSAKNSETQMTISPFASFQSDLGNSPRTVETWSNYTIRTGIALKFGTKKSALKKVPDAMVATPVVVVQEKPVTVIAEKDILFTVRAPKVVPAQRQVKETFPLRNTIFFDMGSSNIPSRYVQLNRTQAAAFREEGLQQNQPDNLNTGRSARQMAVYYNILNIKGDRLRSNPNSTITLTGASANNPDEGKLMAENIKAYLVNNFSIDASRINTVGRSKPVVPSEQPGATQDLALLREGDRRVDIESNSNELLLQVGGSSSPFLKPVQFTSYQLDPLDSHVILNAEGASQLLKSWSVEVTDERGFSKYYGPYYTDRASVPGSTILGDNVSGNYKIVMTGETVTGRMIKKESAVRLLKKEDSKEEGLRYSILFDFDKADALASYEKFLTDVVTPLIAENSTVIIHGHTDNIGDAKYNHNLSHERAIGTQRIIESALSRAGKRNVKFESFGFGEDENLAPFNNKFPEERFYNRSVIIDIIPGN
ncbi:MAG: OmpA family protein [Sediminibacterium sp. Gen4]|jgi:outer membrane protein OmpA-like peptidoglycan-associated protein|uniref:OmpA family protein n=1 Tax=unclassified Sediminibacterium TaxID=2635961 RepID=UPI0015BE21C0|nr:MULTISPECIES: OmpA family protein [unclassified Sediminibacterium]MBW0160497.1 OmpA family protein [Sediminibacterium sp.]MBW0162816.1 OmpA family protein [Sediminibacterium sp.]NWK67383.1 OmpA family protein [Sediminibacterium sp. Gen4]